MKRRILPLVTALTLCLSLPAQAADISIGATPAISSNVGENDYEAWSKPVTSYIYDNGIGFTRVEYIDSQVVPGEFVNGQMIGGRSVKDQMVVEEYTDNFQLLNQYTIEMELPIWGGFYAGEKYNFLFFGQRNKEENNSVESVRIVKYGKDWKRLGQASICGNNIVGPYDNGSLRCAEYGDMIYVRAGHSMYKSPDGNNHQASMTICFQQTDMKVIGAYSYGGIGYVSHSLNQFVIVDHNKNVITLDHGDAYPRGFELMRWKTKAGATTIDLQTTNLPLVSFPETKSYQWTGASAGGLVETKEGYLISYNQDITGAASNVRNVYLSFVPYGFTEKTKPQIICLTDSGTINTTPILAPTSLDGGWALWEEKNEAGYTLCYSPYSADGTVGEVMRVNGPRLSDCSPILCGDGIVWYATDNSVPTFYILNDSGVQSYATSSDVENSSASDWAKEEIMEAMNVHLIPANLQRYYVQNITRLDFCQLMVTLIEQATGKGIDTYLSEKKLMATTPFTDTNNAAVLAAHALGIVNGTTETTFNPSGFITRQEAAAMLSRTAKVLGLSAGAGESFNDTADIPSWAAEEITFISGLIDPVTGKRVMGGTGKGAFSPLSSYSREQAYITALRLLNCVGSEKSL